MKSNILLISCSGKVCPITLEMLILGTCCLFEKWATQNLWSKYAHIFWDDIFGPCEATPYICSNTQTQYPSLTTEEASQLRSNTQTQANPNIHYGNLEISQITSQSEPPLLWRPPYIAYFPFSNFVQPLPHFPVTSNPHSLFFMLSCFFGWMGDHATFDVLFYLMIICEGPWCVFYALRHQVDRGLTHGMSFYWFLLVLWFDIAQTNTHCTLRGQWDDTTI